MKFSTFLPVAFVALMIPVVACGPSGGSEDAKTGTRELLSPIQPPKPAYKPNQREQIPASDLESLATAMAGISGAGAIYPSTVQHFRFLIPRFTEICTDVSTQLDMTNLIVATLMVMEEDGLTENLRDLSDSLYWILTSLYARSPNPLNMKDLCHGIFPMYASARISGMSARDAREGIVDLVFAAAFPQ
ncbi:MAG: hypothetical protein F4Z35_04370 [Dehalococcoidia bacterium]|nr:hypothetical protein [Dehalococcoidia bacterium]